MGMVFHFPNELVVLNWWVGFTRKNAESSENIEQGILHLIPEVWDSLFIVDLLVMKFDDEKEFE